MIAATPSHRIFLLKLFFILGASLNHRTSAAELLALREKGRLLQIGEKQGLVGFRGPKPTSSPYLLPREEGFQLFPFSLPEPGR